MRTILMLMIFVCISSGVFAGDPDAIIGTWKTPEDKSTIVIYKCGDKYCGKITDLKEKVYPPDDKDAGKTKIDRKNPDKSKRQDPVIGLQLMKNFSFKGEIWQGGTIYDPEKGKTYKCKATLKGDSLNVRGYIGIPTLGRTSIWTRVAE